MPDASNTFGAASAQQDAQEFFNFLINVIEDETNRARDKPTPRALTTAEELQLRKAGRHAEIKFYWQQHCLTHQSIITQKLGFSTMRVGTCDACGYQMVNHSNISHYMSLNIPEERQWTIDELLRKQYSNSNKVLEVMDDVKCDRCWAERGVKTKRLSSEVITRLPDTLVIHLVRHSYVAQSGQKNQSRVAFPLEDLDMKPYFFGPPGEEAARRSSTHYRCYAVVQHLGEKMLHKGHYITLVRDEDGEWSVYDDTQVKRVDARETQKSHSYLLFYERAG